MYMYIGYKKKKNEMQILDSTQGSIFLHLYKQGYMKKPDKGSLSALALTIVNTAVQSPYNGLIFLRIECSAPALSSYSC